MAIARDLLKTQSESHPGSRQSARHKTEIRNQPRQSTVLRTLHVAWSEIEALFVMLGAEISEREGSRIGVFLFGEIRVFHRPHPKPDTDKGAVASVRKWLEANGVTP